MMDKCRLTATCKDDGRGHFENIDLTQEQHSLKPNLEDNRQQVKPACVLITAIVDELLPASKPIRPKMNGDLVVCNYVMHRFQIKPENIDGLTECERIAMDNSVMGCIIVAMDFEETHILGNVVDELSHSGWVKIFTQLGVFGDVPECSGLDEEAALNVTWESSSRKYHYRYVILHRHWDIISFKEQDERLNMKVLSLTELVDAAEDMAAAKTE
jgi:hypothetical protein